MRPRRAWARVLLLLLVAAGPAGAAPAVDPSTWVDHDTGPIAPPPAGEENFWGYVFHAAVTDELAHAFDVPDKLLRVADLLGAHTRREAVNVNAFDEVPNSSWFTNRNHVRAVPVSEMRQGPDAVVVPAKPWRITHRMKGGTSLGFVIKDGSTRWLVKLDPIGHPQLSSGSDIVVRTLLAAAGYNVPHNEPVRFRRSDLTLDPALEQGTNGERLTSAELDSLLAHGAVFADGSQAGYASRYLPGKVLGSPNMEKQRAGDANDWYAHVDRRELRGFFVLCSWLGYWDTKDPNFLDTFVATRDTMGHVVHYVLDSKSALGAQSTGPKTTWKAFEHQLDLGWTARRLCSLGFAVEPWRRAQQESGLPAVGNFESDVYEPAKFATEIPQPAFRAMTDRDGYWGAKIVASFSDAQIAAAVAAAHYDDPRATAFLVHSLEVRRDKVARHWFGRVAPLDFFAVEGDSLRFHDLAVDLGLAPARRYDVELSSPGRHERLRLDGAALPLAGLGASRLELELGVTGASSTHTRVELTRATAGWAVTRVRHG